MEVSEKIKRSEAPAIHSPSEDAKTNHSDGVSIWLDTYDDLFSDFDPRSFSERTLSDDFLNELKKFSRENELHEEEIRLLIPEKNRDQGQELIITRRIHSFFRKMAHLHQQKVRSQKKNGIVFVLIAIVLMVGASYVSSLKSENILMHTLLVILEPAGWFLMWAGLDDLINSSLKKAPELNFYNKMSKCKIVFRNIVTPTTNEKNN